MTNHLRRAVAVASTLLGLLSIEAAAQQGTTISGRVLNDAQSPLEGVSVSIATLGTGAYTDGQGRYSFSVPASRAAAQPVTVTARRIGFNPKTATVTLSGATITQDFTLSAAAT